MGTVRQEPGAFADLLRRLGNISAKRIRMRPPPGTATEKDVIRIHDQEGRLYELVEGVLVEKAMGVQASFLAVVIVHLINNYLDEHDLGIALGADGMVRFGVGLVRIPDACFVSWSRIGRRKVPDEVISPWIPELTIEVISTGNTKQEMTRKCSEYFDASVRLVWYVYPKMRTVDVYTSPNDVTTMSEKDTLNGGAVLPDFKLSLQRLFARPG